MDFNSRGLRAFRGDRGYAIDFKTGGLRGFYGEFGRRRGGIQGEGWAIQGKGGTVRCNMVYGGAQHLYNSILQNFNQVPP